MNDENEMDQDLKRLGQMMTPDANFADRVMQRVDAAENKPRRNWRLPVGAAMAASLVVVMGWSMHMRGEKRTDPPQEVQLVRSSTQWQAVSERPVLLAGEVPAREISRQLYDRVVWTDPQRHATFERVVPKETIKLVTLEHY